MLLSRVYLVALSLALLAYGIVSVCFGLGEPGVKNGGKFCALWLCPEEFSGRRIIALLQQDAPAGGAALIDLRRALTLDPASAYAWADLGDGLANANDFVQARYSFERALAAGPRNPIILFRAANFFFRAGDSKRSLTTFAEILRNPRLTDYYGPAFFTYQRMDAPIETILENGMPGQRTAVQGFLHFLQDGRRLEDAEAVWSWAAQRGLTDERLTADYLAFLIRQKQETLAADTWAGLQGGACPSYRRTNWLCNADFKQALTPAVFDWHLEPAADVEVQAKNGEIELVFKGESNVDYHGVWQESVLPAGRWQLRAAVKTAGITTDQGVRLRIGGDGFDWGTEPMIGTHGWSEVQQTFEIPAGRGPVLVRAEIARLASKRFDNKITGTAWVRQWELAPLR